MLKQRLIGTKSSFVYNNIVIFLFCSILIKLDIMNLNEYKALLFKKDKTNLQGILTN